MYTQMLITKMSCITVPIEAYRSNAMFKCDILRSIFKAAPWSKRWKKAAECCRILGSILHHANLFSMLWVRAAIGIRLDGTVMHYKLYICHPDIRPSAITINIAML